MTTFGADGSKLTVRGTSAPAEEQLAPPADLTTPDDGDDEATEAAVDAFIADAATDDDPEVLDAEPSVEVEVVDKPEPDPSSSAIVAIDQRFDVKLAGENWPYDLLEFKGDLLGIRLPARQALAAFSLASSKYVSLGVKNDLTGLFIARHLSPESYGRVFSRLMDPDENDYDVDTVGELFNAIVTAAIESDKADEKGDAAK